MKALRTSFVPKRLKGVLSALALAVTSLLSLAWSTPALAQTVTQFAKSDDTDLTPVYILGGVGVGVLIVAIVVRVASSKGGGSGRHGR